MKHFFSILFENIKVLGIFLLGITIPCFAIWFIPYTNRNYNYFGYFNNVIDKLNVYIIIILLFQFIPIIILRKILKKKYKHYKCNDIGGFDKNIFQYLIENIVGIIYGVLFCFCFLEIFGSRITLLYMLPFISIAIVIKIIIYFIRMSLDKALIDIDFIFKPFYAKVYNLRGHDDGKFWFLLLYFIPRFIIFIFFPVLLVINYYIYIVQYIINNPYTKYEY